MPTTIILVPDIYYRNWDESPFGKGGEMWLCLRPMIATGNRSDAWPLGDRIGDFLGWAASPHRVRDAQGDKLYDIKSPNELGLHLKPCGPDQVYMPINLPTELDVQIRIGRRDAAGNELPEERIDVPRTTGCKAVSGNQEGEDALNAYDPAIALPFAKMFNVEVERKFVQLLGINPRDDAKLAQASFAFLQQMEAGRRIRFDKDQIRDEYDKPGTKRPVLEKKPGDRPVTTVYWFLGLMVQLGTKADIGALRQIDRVDIALRDSKPGDYGFLPFPNAQGGEESAYEYFQKVGKDFAHTLTTELSGHEERIYAGPGFRGFQRVDPPPTEDTSLWVIEGGGPQVAASGEAAHGGLARLAAIEVRGGLAPAVIAPDGKPPPLPDIGKDLTVVPGLYVTGTLKRYRRFPDVPGAVGDPLRVTVMTFEPDAAMAGELAKLREHYAVEGVRKLLGNTPTNPAIVAELARLRAVLDDKDGTKVKALLAGPASAPELTALRSLVSDAELRSHFTANSGGWHFELLHGGILPWDGPNPVYRMLAIPEGKAKAKVAGSLMCPAKNAAFFLAAPIEALPLKKVGVRHLWDSRPWGTISSAAALETKWVKKAGTAWRDIRVNALQVAGITDKTALERTSAHAMLIDEFDLVAAESPLRLEKILEVTALSPRMAAIAAIKDLKPDDLRNFDPLRDYEDDFINLNTARVWRPDNAAPDSEVQLEEAMLRSPQRSEAQPKQCKVEDAERRQTIPLLHAWPSDPLDRQEIASLDDDKAKLVKINWQMIREDIARRHDLLPETDKGPYQIDLEHTYGDRLRVMKGNAPRTFDRSTRRSWPVALPTFVEAKEADKLARPFLISRYLPDTSGDSVELEFDLSFLTFPELTAFEARSDKRYALAVSAWRSLAELASGEAILKLHVRLASFDLLSSFSRPGTTTNPAEVAAREGFAGGWASGIYQGPSITITNGTDLDVIRTWASNYISGTQKAGKFTIPLGANVKPGETAHLLRVDIEIARHKDAAPVLAADQLLAPISQQPGLFQVNEDSMQGAWARLGFGVDLKELNVQIAGPVWPHLDHARTLWASERTAYADSVTPEGLKELPPAPKPPTEDPWKVERKKREVQAALTGALEGSDWFAPPGLGPRTKAIAVEPILVPIGFAPCRPHVTLKQMTQDALQRLATALRDTIDLAYLGWTTLDGDGWRARFDAIAALAREAVPEKNGVKRLPGGLLSELADLAIERLLFPEPDGLDTENADKVRTIVKAFKDAAGKPSGDFKYFSAAVRRRLLADPALFTDAKALLLTAINFVPGTSKLLYPPATALARARFNRKGLDPLYPQDPATTTLTLDNLVFAGATDTALTEHRLAFLETLDDARYGDAFELPVTTDPKKPLDYIVDSYEELVDPRADLGAWPQQPAVLPLAAANDGRAKRIVHLASRALVTPPLLRWTGESDAIGKALAAGAPDWSIENLEKGLAGIAPGGTRLRIVAKHSPSAEIGTVERGTAFVLYRVTGDEERSVQFEQAFANDSFFVRLTRSDYDRAPQPKAVNEAGGKLESEALLRELLFAGTGSDQAAEAIRALALSGTDRSGDLSALIQPGDGQLPSLDFALIRLRQDGGDWIIDIGATGASETTALIRHVALFKPDGQAADAVRTAFLLIGFETTVWAPIESELCHGRNLPQSRWTGQADAVGAPRYAPQFWQTVSQDTPPSRHSLERRARKNEPRHWKTRPTHVIKLKSGWRLPKTPTELLTELLFTEGHAIDDGQLSDTILSKTSVKRIFDQQLSIQIAHEQFGEDPTPHAEPLGNFPLEANALIGRHPSLEPALPWFDPFYDQFSVSLRWFAPSGTSLLTLERIYVEFV